MKRTRVKSVRKDRKVFATTAAKTREINLHPVSVRGGTRL